MSCSTMNKNCYYYEQYIYHHHHLLLIVYEYAKVISIAKKYLFYADNVAARMLTIVFRMFVGCSRSCCRRGAAIDPPHEHIVAASRHLLNSLFAVGTAWVEVQRECESLKTTSNRCRKSSVGQRLNSSPSLNSLPLLTTKTPHHTQAPLIKCTHSCCSPPTE